MDTKRLLGAMQYGFSISHQDGHRWIEWNENYTYDCTSMLQAEYNKTGFNQPSISIKVYEGYDEALNRIDEYIKSLNLPSLSEVYIDFGGENN